MSESQNRITGPTADPRRLSEDADPCEERINYRSTRTQLARIDQLVQAGEYPTRSEAIRALIRQGLKHELGYIQAREADN